MIEIVAIPISMIRVHTIRSKLDLGDRSPNPIVVRVVAK